MGDIEKNDINGYFIKIFIIFQTTFKSKDGSLNKFLI